MTTFSLFSKPMLTPEAFEASRSFFAYSRDTNALPPRLADAVLKMSSDNAVAARDVALANDDEVLLHLMPSAVVTNVAGYKLCKPTFKVFWDELSLLLLAFGMLCLVGGLCYMVPLVLASDEDWFTKLCAIGGTATALIAVFRVAIGTRRAFTDTLRLLSGKGTVHAEKCFLRIANYVSVVTAKGLIYSSTDEEFLPTFVPWNAVGSARLENGANTGIIVLDREGCLITRLYCPATKTMTSTDVLDLIRRNIVAE